MKANEKTAAEAVEISLLGLAKAFTADAKGDITEGTKFPVSFSPNVELTAREMTREATRMDDPSKVNADGRIPTGKAPVLVGVGFTEDGAKFKDGAHAMIAGNFTSVFTGTTYGECVGSFNKAINEGKNIFMTAKKSAKGKLYMEWSIE
jgi:hypothetical protein